MRRGHIAFGSTRRGAIGGEGRGGFTLLEVVLAMTILFVGVTAVLGLLSFGAALTRTAALRSEAADAIEAVVRDLEQSFFPVTEEDGRLVAGAPRPIEERPVPAHPGLVYSAVGTPLAPAGGPEPAGFDGGAALEYRVDVELRWSAGQATRSQRFRVLLTREVPFEERLRRGLGGNPLPPAR